jgi:hypothetical protein
MKLPTFLLIATLASYGLAYPKPAELHDRVLRSNGPGTCSMSSNGSSHSITFQAQFDGLTVTGEGQSGPSGIQLSLKITDADALVIQHPQSSSGSSPSSSAPSPQGPQNIISALAGLPDQVNAIISECHLQRIPDSPSNISDRGLLGRRGCPSNSQTCCTGSPPSRCTGDEIQKCVNSEWVTSSCPYPQYCLNIPVANAGASCTASEFCQDGQPSYCSGDGYQSCVNGKWAATSCPYPQTCQNIPVANAGVYCVGSEFCEDGQASYCDGDGYQNCVNGRWEFVQCKSPLSCLPFPVQGAGVSCSGAG